MSKTARKSISSVTTLHREMRQLLEERRDPSYVEFIVTSIGVRDRVIGVRVPEIRDAVKQLLAAHRKIAVDDVIALMDRAAEKCVREELLFATFALTRFRRKLTPALLNRVDDWIDALDNWETCDQLALGVAAELVGRDINEAERLLVWAGSKNPWRRRFALATAAALNQKGRKFPLETLRVCALVLNDSDPQVRKAVGWAIREASDVDESAAFAFLRDHRDAIHPTVLRESLKKLTKAHQQQLLGVKTKRVTRSS